MREVHAAVRAASAVQQETRCLSRVQRVTHGFQMHQMRAEDPKIQTPDVKAGIVARGAPEAAIKAALPCGPLPTPKLVIAGGHFALKRFGRIVAALGQHR